MKHSPLEPAWRTVHMRQPWQVHSDDAVQIEPSCLREVQHLLVYHYRQQPLTCCSRVLAARVEGVLAGCLIVTHASLNGAHRAIAWPDWPRHLSKQDHAAFVNANLRRIARVAVLPTLRGQGIATRLVRAYLACPVTMRTEAIAAMGVHAPIFVAGGMRAIDPPVSRQHRAIVKLLAMHGVVPWRLMDERYVGEACGNARLVDGCRSWARGSRVTRGLAEAPPAELLRACAWRASHHKGVYVHEREAQ